VQELGGAIQRRDSVGGVQFGEHVLHVLADGLAGKAEDARDLGVGLSRATQCINSHSRRVKPAFLRRRKLGTACTSTMMRCTSPMDSSGKQRIDILPAQKGREDVNRNILD